MKVWITKHALSAGIQDGVEQDNNGNSTLVAYSNIREWMSYSHVHRSHTDAVARAEQMRLTKIASLEKQIAKLREMRFA